MKNIERTFAIIKTGAVNRGSVNRIVERIEQAEIKIAGMTYRHLTRDEASALYAEHQGRDYFERLVRSVTGGTVLLVLEGGNVISRWRALMGATDPLKAVPGTLRWDFAGIHGIGMPDNCVHGSDSEASAAREIGLFFPDLVPGKDAGHAQPMLRFNKDAELELCP